MAMFEKEYELEFFKNNGYTRKVCGSCGTPFWSLNPDITACGDTPCVEYGFINNPVTKEKYDVTRMRDEYLKYFEKNGHTILDRYPVIARWRDDIYLTIASIADFQPHVTSGLVPPPANPLVISQPCIRLVDLDIVGKSGRHLSNFEMMGHHAFNSPDEKIYWKDKTVEYCNTFFNEVLGIPNDEITYKEDPWAGGGNAGPALEVMVKGLELATLVFMSMETDPNGEFEIKGERYSPMDMNIVDPGYGLERLVWASQGTPTIYEAIYPDLTRELFERFELMGNIEILNEKNILEDYAKLSGMMTFDSADSMSELRKLLVKQLSKKGHDITIEKLSELMAPIENIYALADHSRALTFMFGDGVVPSNVKAGYIARLILRRTLRIIDEMGVPLDLTELVDKQIEDMKRWAVESGIVKRPYLNLSLGLFGDPARRDVLRTWLRYLPDECDWIAETAGRNWLPTTVEAVLSGGHLRAGMEDSIYMYPHRDDFIKSSAEVVAKVRRIVEELGYEIATPKEAREILRLGEYWG